jgi:menaquinone-dependent protoporphyrinogen IX oxidase
MAYGTAKGATRKLVGSIATSLAGTGAEASLLHHFILKKLNLLRQARDKHTHRKT